MEPILIGISLLLICIIAMVYIKLSRKIDIVAQFKWEIYASDAIDGLQADVVENKSNETLTNLQFGLIYHLNFNKNI